MDIKESYDVVVVGGGAAGLSAALVLGRSRRSVLVIDAGEPRNAGAGHMHNYLGREGATPAELLTAGREEVGRYGVEVRSGRVVSAVRTGGGFALGLEDGGSVSARRLVLATGVVDELPQVPGLEERFGRDVLHCPYCHGWEVADSPLGVVASGADCVERALLFRQWSEDVVILLNGRPAPQGEDAERLAARGIRWVPGRIARVVVEDDAVTGVELAGGEFVPRAALVVTTVPTPDTTLLDAVGGPEAPGVKVVGNAATPYGGVISSAADGMVAGTLINHDLLLEETAAAVAEYRNTPKGRAA
ncbi:NAD(P)/FAD-dependent oxidoreductase [Streptomyces sp. WMMB 322]|uniref:NAD(P)/FAD-dependent oxidoreductase n=1 Tax=Streptomyces sp. WMMB 322 TaxID=1286821 RepID=UPI000823ED30|nr:NAD(P)/FAD-dependent oxidoreductase [Streptomyces sp. WMMB 322]SCK48049.1 thioredoxin reductase (NADPH) [Streptomyces sp. WMMB 322]